jgi:uncharacterized membrane protein
MAFCTKCGAQTEGRFCANCGAPVSSEAAGSSQPGAASQIAPSEGLSENLASALCYLLWFITGVLFLLLEPYSHNRTIRFHALQSILLTIAVAVIWFVWGIVASALMPVPFIGVVLSTVLWGAISLAILACWLFLMWKAYNGQRFVMPIIGPFAEKQA